MKKSVCFTGYRAEKFSFPLNNKSNEFLNFRKNLIQILMELIQLGYTDFYTGGCDGFDILVAEELILIKGKQKNIKVHIVMPFKKFGDDFSKRWKDSLNNILKISDNITYVCENYERGCYQKRNKFMVDNSNYVIAYSDGKKGGTYNTIVYAKKCNKEILNLCENSIQLKLF